MAWSKKKEITVIVDDFIEKDALFHAEFKNKDGKPCLVQVVPDTDTGNPREEYDHLFKWSTTSGAGYTDKDAMSLEEIERKPSRKFLEEYIVFPLYLYRHSGDVLSTSCARFRMADLQGWDSGCMGIAYLEKKRVLSEYGWKKLTKARHNKLYEYLKGEVEEMNAYISGSVYGVIVTELESEQSDSCWGYICSEKKDVESAVFDMLYGWLDDAGRKKVVEKMVA
jgi:hypothetical protein